MTRLARARQVVAGGVSVFWEMRGRDPECRTLAAAACYIGEFHAWVREWPDRESTK